MTAKDSEIYSMTGYGRGSVSGARYRATVEIRSVNSRFLEIRPRFPRTLLFLEPAVRERIEKKVRRGMLDVSVIIQMIDASESAVVNEELAAAYVQKADVLAKRLDLPHGLTALSLFRLPGVVAEVEGQALEQDAEIKRIVLGALDDALTGMMEMRQKEGEKLAKVLLRELEEVREHGDWIAKHKDELNSRHFQKIQNRLKDWIDRAQVANDEARLYQEVAYYLDRSDITEELDRLTSHIRQFEDAIASPKAKTVGKRLDFLAQELGREVNTIGSKSDQIQITNKVVEMKLTLERIREQVQNLE